jgi:hypothetical protein
MCTCSVVAPKGSLHDSKLRLPKVPSSWDVACTMACARWRVSHSSTSSSAAPVAHSPFDSLPDELLVHILLFVGSRWILTSVHAVCRRCVCATLDASLISDRVHDCMADGLHVAVRACSRCTPPTLSVALYTHVPFSVSHFFS